MSQGQLSNRRKENRELADSDALPVGHHRQLFVDDFIVASREGLTRILHPPVRHPQNPVLRGTEPWEARTVWLNGRGILRDCESGEFKMWYEVVYPIHSEDGRARTHYTVPLSTAQGGCLTGYAVSGDGIHWRKPNLGQVEWDGSRNNNLLRWGEVWMRRPNVIRDPHDPDPARRFKMLYTDVLGGRVVEAKAYSHDGIDWKLNADGRPWFPRHNANLLGWDPRIGRYVFYGRTPAPHEPAPPGVRKASLGRATSVDFVTRSEVQTILTPEPQETDKVFNGLAAFIYEDLYLGFLWIRFGRETSGAELVVSRDGIGWQRPFPGQFFIYKGDSGSWDGVMVRPMSPVLHQDSIWIYYGGWNGPYGIEEHVDAVQRGEPIERAVGLATLPLDRFVSMRAAAHTGTLTTRVLLIPGGKLKINADVQADLAVEILDPEGRRLPGYGVSECEEVRGDGLSLAVRWRGHADLDELRGKKVRLRFLWRRGDLYSFRFARGSADDQNHS